MIRKSLNCAVILEKRALNYPVYWNIVNVFWTYGARQIYES
jgi:hypothetical protein